MALKGIEKVVEKSAGADTTVNNFSNPAPAPKSETKTAVAPGGERVTYNSVNDTYKSEVAKLRSDPSFLRSRKDYENSKLSEDEKDKRAYADLVAWRKKSKKTATPKAKPQPSVAETENKQVPEPSKPALNPHRHWSDGLPPSPSGLANINTDDEDDEEKKERLNDDDDED